jgi:DNA-directed RNA polymerase I subunit RPA1
VKSSKGITGIDSDDDADDDSDDSDGDMDQGGKKKNREISGYESDEMSEENEDNANGKDKSKNSNNNSNSNSSSKSKINATNKSDGKSSANMSDDGSDYSGSDGDDDEVEEEHKKTDSRKSSASTKDKSKKTRQHNQPRLRGASGKIDPEGIKSSASERWIEFEITFPAVSRRLLMLQLVEQVVQKVNVRETKDIANAYGITTDVWGEERVAVQTEGVNFEAIWDLSSGLHDLNESALSSSSGAVDVLDLNKLKSNDIYQIMLTYGVEAARQSIVSEINGVFKVYGIDVNPRHLSLIADFMTRTGSYIPMNRSGMDKCPSPLLQMSFETTCAFLTNAAQQGASDNLESASARIVVGSAPKVGTGCFDLMIPLSVNCN